MLLEFSRKTASAILEREVREKVIRKKIRKCQTQEESPALDVAVARDSTPFEKVRFAELGWTDLT